MRTHWNLPAWPPAAVALVQVQTWGYHLCTTGKPAQFMTAAKQDAKHTDTLNNMLGPYQVSLCCLLQGPDRSHLPSFVIFGAHRLCDLTHKSLKRGLSQQQFCGPLVFADFSALENSLQTGHKSSRIHWSQKAATQRKHAHQLLQHAHLKLQSAATRSHAGNAIPESNSAAADFAVYLFFVHKRRAVYSTLNDLLSDLR